MMMLITRDELLFLVIFQKFTKIMGVYMPQALNFQHKMGLIIYINTFFSIQRDAMI